MKNLLGPNSESCPTRPLLDQLGEKWTVLVLLAASSGPIRFDALKRVVEGITQKMLGQTLRRLVWNGLIERRTLATMPVMVEYELTDLGRTLLPLIEGLRSWAMMNFPLVAEARSRYEAEYGTVGRPD